MTNRNPLDLAVAIALIVLGILLLVGRFSLGALIPLAGVVLIVLGILVLIRTLPGGPLLGAVALVLGILLVGNWIDYPRSVDRSIRSAMDIINIVAGVICLILGVLKIRGTRW